MNLREQIIAKKAELGLTTETLSRLSEVPRGTINKILNGETTNPRAWTLFRLAYALGIDTNALNDDKDEPANNQPRTQSRRIELPLYESRNSATLPEFDFAVAENDKTYLLIKQNEMYNSNDYVAVKTSSGIMPGRYFRSFGTATIMFDDSSKPPVGLNKVGDTEIIGTIVARITVR